MKEIRVRRLTRLFAPAKVNLGLEIIGRRDDGYHEIVTILQAVSLFDVIELRPADRFTFGGSAYVVREQDLTLRAIRMFEERFDARLVANVKVEKHIPVAGGLGGGSSDAGTILGALAGLSGVATADVAALAAELGSDVPFFVRGGTALASGTGTTLSPLPSLDSLWFAIITPSIEISNKTAHLYNSLQPEDFSDGESTRAAARSIERGEPLVPSSLSNGFSRALYAIPEIDRARQTMLGLGAPFVLPCGAGPSLFTIADSWQDARNLANRLRTHGLTTTACAAVAPDLNRDRIL